jgi:predicted lipid-binding transport protein (Tim44 family)
MKWWLVAVSMVLALVGLDAEAKRLGGGKSVGRQSGNVTQHEAAAPAKAPGVSQPASGAAAQPAPAAPAPSAPPPRRPWAGVLGGLAAGLGLAWLAHSLGMGEGFGQLLMVVLLAMGGMMLLSALLRSRQPGLVMAPAPAAPKPYYRPENVGNDASARPYERSAETISPAAAPSMIGSALSGSQSWGVPAGFDTQGFLQSAKTNFVSLQAAWDRSDIPALRAMMTDAMLAEIRTQLAEREAHPGSSPNVTEVVMIEARLLGIEELGTEYMASVEFSGMIREDASAGPSPFREVWNMTRPRDGSTGWLVAGVQALQ